MLAEELFAKALRSFETCVLVNNNLCGKSFSSVRSPTTFAERSEVTLVPFFIADFNLLSCELDHFTFKVLKQKKKKNYNTFTVPCEKCKTVSFASSLMKNIAEPSTISRFRVKLICCIAFGSEISFRCLLKSVAIIL